jgi:hypothetical protein
MEEHHGLARPNDAIPESNIAGRQDLVGRGREAAGRIRGGRDGRSVHGATRPASAPGAGDTSQQREGEDGGL